MRRFSDEDQIAKVVPLILERDSLWFESLSDTSQTDEGVSVCGWRRFCLRVRVIAHAFLAALSTCRGVLIGAIWSRENR